MSALSAEIWRRCGVSGDAMSTITSWFAAPVSRTQTNLSLSMVVLRKLINSCATPMAGSCARMRVRARVCVLCGGGGDSQREVHAGAAAGSEKAHAWRAAGRLPPTARHHPGVWR
jgi:hypothetical protein